MGDPFAHLKAHKVWGRKPGLQGVSGFVEQALFNLRDSVTLDLLLAGLVVYFGRRWIVGRLATLGPFGSRRSMLVALLALSALACEAVWATLPQSLTFPRWLVKDLDSHHDNFVFFLFLGLGLRAWSRRGPFWGCLILFPMVLAASSGSPLSMTRVALMAFPACIDDAEICEKRWIFLGVVAGGIAGQVILFQRFTRLDFVG